MSEASPIAYVPAPGSTMVLGPLRGPLQLVRLDRGSELYFAPDHLLVLREKTEGAIAKRFAYADIRGMTTTPNRRAAFATAAWLLMILVALMLALLGFVPGFGEFALVWSGLIGAVGFIGLLAHLRLGPTCTVTLFTATDAEELDALSRVVHAEQALAQLAQRVHAVQGALPEDALSRPRTDWNAVDHARPALAARFRYPGLAPDDGAVTHLAFYALLLLLGGLLVLDARYYSEAKNTLDATLYAIALLLGCYAVARQRGSVISTGLKRFTLATLFFEAFFLYLTSFAIIIPIIVLADSPDDFMNMSQNINFSTPENAMFLPLLYGMILWHLIPGIVGLLLTVQYRLRHARVVAARATADASREAPRP